MDSNLDKNTTAHKSDLFRENEAINRSRLEQPKTNKTLINADELIAFLQNHRENRRARQVFEWEARRRETRNYL